MRLLVALIAIVFTTFNLNAQNPNGARFKFNEETHDFGTLKENDPASTEFTFTNTGKEPLVISNCSASCGCTVPVWPQNPILPGGKGTITVKFNTQGKNGPFEKAIYISSNAETEDVTKKSYELKIKGSVTPAAVPQK